MGAGSEQQNTTYIPSPGEKKLLEALANPENHYLNVSELCDLAGVDRGVFYRSVKKPEFAALYRETLFELIRNSAGPMVKAAVKYATEGNHNYFKTLMEMSQLYTPKQNMELTGKNGEPLIVRLEGALGEWAK